MILLAACGGGDGDRSPQVAVNAQMEAMSGAPAAFAYDLAALASAYGGDISSELIEQDPAIVELRIPVQRWAEAFAELRARPEAARGEQVWGQDITDQIEDLERELESAIGEEAAQLQAMLEFRIDRVERATIVVRIRRPG